MSTSSIAAGAAGSLKRLPKTVPEPYEAWLCRVITENANGTSTKNVKSPAEQVSAAIDAKTRTKLNDDVKRRVMEFVGGEGFKPRVTPYGLHKKKWDSNWREKKSKWVDMVLWRLD